VDAISGNLDRKNRIIRVWLTAPITHAGRYTRIKAATAIVSAFMRIVKVSAGGVLLPNFAVASVS
jgi:hypothetical protein